MKLPCWMHSKFLQNNSEAPKDFSIGQPSMEDLQCYHKGSDCSKENNLGNSFTSVRTARIEGEYLEEDEMNVINVELEKVKGASSRYESCNGAIFIYPLLSCLLGSTIELQETTLPVKRGNRMSLGELFQKAELIEDLKSDKCSIHLMKSKNSTTIDSATTDSKTHKIQQISSRKVHPDNTTFCHKYHESTDNSETHFTASNNEDITIYPQGAISKESTWSFKNQSNTSQFTQSRGNEYWVKTDADYLVLELYGKY